MNIKIMGGITMHPKEFLKASWLDASHCVYSRQDAKRIIGVRKEDGSYEPSYLESKMEDSRNSRFPEYWENKVTDSKAVRWDNHWVVIPNEEYDELCRMAHELLNPQPKEVVEKPHCVLIGHSGEMWGSWFDTEPSFDPVKVRKFCNLEDAKQFINQEDEDFFQ